MELVTADRVVTGRPGEVLDEAGVLYEGNRIEWVGRVSELTADRAAGAHRSHYPGAATSSQVDRLSRPPGIRRGARPGPAHGARE